MVRARLSLSVRGGNRMRTFYWIRLVNGVCTGRKGYALGNFVNGDDARRIIERGFTDSVADPRRDGVRHNRLRFRL